MSDQRYRMKLEGGSVSVDLYEQQKRHLRIAKEIIEDLAPHGVAGMTTETADAALLILGDLIGDQDDSE